MRKSTVVDILYKIGIFSGPFVQDRGPIGTNLNSSDLGLAGTQKVAKMITTWGIPVLDIKKIRRLNNDTIEILFRNTNGPASQVIQASASALDRIASRIADANPRIRFSDDRFSMN